MVRAAAGVLGLVALFVAAVVGMLAAAGILGGNVPASSPSGGPRVRTVEQVEQIKQTAAKTGENVSAGNLSWAVTDAYRTTELHKATPPPETVHGDFVIVTFTVKNTSDEPITLTEDSVALIDGEGRKFPAYAFDNSPYMEPEKAILFNERSLLDPGKTEEGQVNFRLAEGSSSSNFKVQLGDADPIVNEEKYVDLGF